tara:strand:- start:1561 stop:2907 length:1347 start_codon:yes stop_codon:yes gene_type:complete
MAGFGTIVKGISSLFGGRGRRREQKAANKEFEAAKAGIANFEFKDAYADLSAERLGAAGQAQAGTLGAAGQAGMGTLGDAQGYRAQGYDSQGYDATGYTAGQTSVGNLARGADTGLTNTMNNLQVSTAGADMANREADQALAASQDLAAQAGTGGGGATALAAAAAKSKAGISADIDRQVKSNEQMRAAAESQLQQGQLAQGNLSSQFDLGQQQFNVGAANEAAKFSAASQNQAAQFGASAANQAAQFGAGAQNQAAQFGAGAQNQFAQSRFGAENNMNQFNTAANNQFMQSQFGADNNMSQFNVGAQNEFARANQSAANNMAQFRAQGMSDIQESQYTQKSDLFDISAGRKAGADNARKQATNDLIGGIGGLGNTLLSDRRVKNNIKLIGVSNKGLNIYSFNYKNDNTKTYQGVMSDEIPNEAVVTHKDGFDRVDYSKLDVEFKLIN